MTSRAVKTFLAMDLGGTKLLASLVQWDDAEIKILESVKLRNDDFASFEDAVKSIPAKLKIGELSGVGVCIGGPVGEESGHLTNRSWVIHKNFLQGFFQLQNVVLMNDMKAQGFGAFCLPSDMLKVLQPGREQKNANKAILAVGTGLGEGVISCVRGEYHAHGGEGSHTTFSSESDEDWRLFQFLSKKYSHVSWERVVSGKDGFRNLLEFHMQDLTDNRKYRDMLAAAEDVGKLVLTEARAGDVLCQKIISRFVDYLAREAGNLCLKTLALGGVYISGGIAIRLEKEIREQFGKSFTKKGRFQEMLQNVPVYLSLDPEQANRGIAYVLGRELS